MTDAAHNPDDYCYRHPDRQSFVLCERCGRTICLECQNHVGGRVLCPDDARSANVTMMPVNTRPPKPKRVRRESILSRIPSGVPLVSSAILVELIVLFLVDTIARQALLPYLVVTPGGPLTRPWTLLTAMFYPGSILTLVIGGFNLYWFGRILEPMFGRRRYLLLYVFSGFGAATVSFLLDGYLLSFYGSVVGLTGALVVVARRVGANPVYLYISCAVSALLAIFFGSWQAFIGGILTGAALGFIFTLDEGDHRTRRATLLTVGVAVVLLVVAFLRALFFLLAS